MGLDPLAILSIFSPERPRARGSRLALAAVWVGVGLWGFSNLRGADTPQRQATEWELKAAYLVNFVRYVKWPPSRFESAKTPFVIGVLGENSFGPMLEEFLKKSGEVRGRSLALRVCKTADEASGCHVVYLSESIKNDLDAVLTALKGKKLLTVSDIEGSTRKGAVCRFYLQDRKIRFEINLDAVRRAELMVDPKLLKLATVIEELPKTEEK